MLLRPCAAAAGVSLHVDTTAYVFSISKNIDWCYRLTINTGISTTVTTATTSD